MRYRKQRLRFQLLVNAYVVRGVFGGYSGARSNEMNHSRTLSMLPTLEHDPKPEKRSRQDVGELISELHHNTSSYELCVQQ
ncbi:hypothetical protein BD413DRAFT_553526 [Trametes elegans]|nr:hypothetical protein BD413DRAFT_553526 [Trametes elegans]